MIAELLTVDQPAAEPLDLADAKRWCRVDIDDDDALLTDLIPAARFLAEKQAGVSLVTRRLQLQFDFPPNLANPIRLPFGPVQAVESIQYFQGGALLNWDPSLWGQQPGRWGSVGPAPGGLWPLADDRPGAYRVTYRAGFGDTVAAVPPAVLSTFRLALRLIVGAFYENREDFANGQFQHMPTSAARILDPLRDWVYAP